MKSIVNAHWPQLEQLHVWFGADRDAPEELGGGWDPQGIDRQPLIQPILDAKGLPNLRELGLMNCCYTDQFLAALVDSRILPQLEVLRVWGGTMFDAGARTILDHYDRFAHLQVLDVSDNFLDDEMQEKLSNLDIDVLIGRQNEPGDWGETEAPMRYPTLGE